jgi:hypothetical protein
MRLGCLRRTGRRDSDEASAPSLSPTPPESGRPTYEETKVESAILSFLVNEEPTGATVAQLTMALGFERDEVEAAVGRLRELETVTEEGGKVCVGPPPLGQQRATGNRTR